VNFARGKILLGARVPPKKMHIYSRPIAVQETAKHRANLSLAVEPLQGKVCQNSLPSGGGRSLGAKISGGSGRPPASILIPLIRKMIALQLCC